MNPPTSLFIGSRFDLDPSRFYNGGIDDVQVFDGTLGDFDVLNLYSQGVQDVAPIVDAGINQTIAMPNALSLSGSVSDDGLPDPPGITTSTWTKNSGPGTVTFADANSPVTTATFSMPGTYVLRLTAADSMLTAYSQATITVLPASAGNTPMLRLMFDEGTGVLAHDSSGSGHDGTLVNNPSWIAGKLGSALFFNGTNNYVQVPTFDLTSNFSVSFWFNPAPGSLDFSHGGYRYLFSWGYPASGSGFAANNINVWLTTASEPTWGTSIRTMVADADDANLADSYALTIKDPANFHFYDGNWHHYCLTVSAPPAERFIWMAPPSSTTMPMAARASIPTPIYL